MNFTQADLADYLAFNCRRMLSTISFEDANDYDEIRWRSLSAALLCPIWTELDQYAREYIQKRWDVLDRHGLAIVHLMLPHDYVAESDFDDAVKEAQRLCDTGKLIHRYVASDEFDNDKLVRRYFKSDDVELQIDTVSVILHAHGIVDPRLAHGACLKDRRKAKGNVLTAA